MERNEIDVMDRRTPMESFRRAGSDRAVRIATIDNFQGEEAEIVILSLIRCNASGIAGFLKMPNRIRVLLSRAKHSMYIIGNAQTAATVDMWAEVISILQENRDFGQSLKLKCPRHADTPLEVSTPEDFATVSPEGGSKLLCGRRLPCGHPCPSLCHSDTLHVTVNCLEPCPRTLDGCDAHPCDRLCGEPCPGRCHRPISGTTLPCSHSVTIPCCRVKYKENAPCPQKVKWTMPKAVSTQSPSNATKQKQ